MKILHISHHYKPCIGGVEKVIEELCSNLTEQGQESKVFCLNRCHNGKKMLAGNGTQNGLESEKK
ncbi:MAG: hypothetical protein QGI60_02575, partial [archaeon]|nr:hypothetical protein [archaeon]